MPYIILDRDGVINYDSDEYIKSPEECLPIPGSLAAIAALNQAGFQIVVATNQSGIARGLYDLATLDLIHAKLRTELAAVGGVIQEFFFCPHHPDEHCACRKPQPGMLYQIRDTYQISLADTYFIGDTITDVEAANHAGCKPLLVLTGKGKKTIHEHGNQLSHVPQFPDLTAAAKYLIQSVR